MKVLSNYKSIRKLCALPALLVLLPTAALAQHIDLSPNNTFTVADSADAVRTIDLPAGADVLRVFADWTTVSGGAQSVDFSVSAVGPDGQTGEAVVFDNAQATTAGVNDLSGEIVLSSKGTGGTYTLTFSNGRSSSSAQFANVQVDTELILEQLIDNGELTVSSPTWDRPDENFNPDGVGSHPYETFTFTPVFTGVYVIDSVQVKDGFIFLYESFDPLAPTSNGVVANDDSPRGLGFSRMSTTLTAGESYTLVSTSFEDISTGQATFAYSNTVRHSVRLDQLPDNWIAFKQLYSLSDFDSDKDGDGIPDGLEYAFGADPEVAGAIEDYYRVIFESDRLGLQFARDPGKTDIEYIVEVIDSLDPGEWTPIATLTDVTPNNAGVEHEVLDSITQSEWDDGRRFIRLRVVYTGGGDEAIAPAMGSMAFDLQPGIDNFVTVPFRASPEFQGTVLNAVDLGSDLFRITAEGGTPFESKDFADLYYVRFLSGSSEGKYFDIVSNNDDQVTFDTGGDNPLSISVGDTFHIVRHWTLAELFPPGVQTALNNSTGNLPFQRGSVVLMPNLAGLGINRAPNQSFFITSTEWRRASDFSNADDTSVYPNAFFLVRQRATYASSVFFHSGVATVEPQVNYLIQETFAHDNLLTHGRPIPLALSSLELGSEFVDSTGNLPFQRQDTLLVWSDTSSLNPSPNISFFRVGGQWRRVSDFSNADDFEIGADEAFIIRKSGRSPAEILTWQNSFND